MREKTKSLAARKRERERFTGGKERERSRGKQGGGGLNERAERWENEREKLLVRATCREMVRDKERESMEWMSLFFSLSLSSQRFFVLPLSLDIFKNQFHDLIDRGWRGRERGES